MAMSSGLVRFIGAIGAIGAVTVGVAACGGTSSASTAASTPAASTVAAKAKTAVAEKAGAAEGASTARNGAASTSAAATMVPVTLGTSTEFALTLGVSVIPAGKVTFKVTNGGAMIHEFIILKTPTPGAQLAVVNGKADEMGSVAETGDMAIGAVKSLTVNLKPGHYVVLCNLPGHYQSGMWKNVIVS